MNLGQFRIHNCALVHDDGIKCLLNSLGSCLIARENRDIFYCLMNVNSELYQGL